MKVLASSRSYSDQSRDYGISTVRAIRYLQLAVRNSNDLGRTVRALYLQYTFTGDQLSLLFVAEKKCNVQNPELRLLKAQYR